MILVTCIPVDIGKNIAPGFPESAVYSAYEQVPCPDCHKMMWLGSRGRKTVEAGNAVALCMLCVIERLGPEAAALANGIVKPTDVMDE